MDFVSVFVKKRLSLILALSILCFSCVSNNNEAPGTRQLSYYCPSLKGTLGDTAVYILDSGRPGANMLLIAGTHGNEIAGIHAASLFIEHARVEKGRVFVIPKLNSPGVLTNTRLVPKELQGMPDPSQYTPPGGTAQYAGIEQRNINRSYPGDESGGLTQKIAYAVMRLLITENINIAIDMHEANPASGLAWTIVSNPKNLSAAALAVFDLEEKNILMHLDVSPPEMDGLSHKEWGNRTQAMSFLVETANPAQAENPSQYKLDDPKYALSRRVAIHLETVRHLVYRANEELKLPPLVYSEIPEYSE